MRSSTRRPLVLLPVLLCALTAGAAALETVERELTLELPLAAGAGVHVENLLGSVIVEGHRERGTVSIEARVVAEAKSLEEAESLAGSIELQRAGAGGAPRIHVAFPVERHTAFRPPRAGVRGLLSRWTAPVLHRGRSSMEYGGRLVEIDSGRKATGLAVHLTVRVPFEARAEVGLSAGLIHGRALRGNVHLFGNGADVVVEQSYGNVDVRTESGNVRVANFQGKTLEVQTVSGDVELVAVRADRARLRSASGSIDADGLTATELFVESASGGVELAGVEPGRAEVTTGSGKIDVASRLEQTREAVIRSATGDVVLRIGELTYFDLFAETKSGSVKTLGLSLDLVEQEEGVSQLRRGNGGPDVRIKAEQGSVTVRPYDASRRDIFVGDAWNRRKPS